jgi:hypothetical protein
MARKEELKEGEGKLLDAWAAPEEAGEPVGCLATTFTFAPDFFEEECLGRFLKLETDAAEDGPLYLIEREEKLAPVTAAVLVDQHQCKGPRSLRWDLHPARLESGILHAKISLLCWSRQVRLIIGSANLTEDGYRRNRETFGVLDYHDGAEAPLPVLFEVTRFLREAMQNARSGAESRAVRRWYALLSHVEKVAATWGTTESEHARQPLRVFAALTGPGRPTLFEHAAGLWPGGSPPNAAWVVSPFFDPPEAPNKPASALWELMRKRDDATVTYCVEMEERPGQKRLFAKAPASLLAARPPQDVAVVQFYRVTADAERPLHAKQLWLEDDRWVAFAVGSSNFTSPGTGIGKAKNYEANLVYVLNTDRERRLYSELNKRFPEGEEIDDPGKLQFAPVTDDGADSAQDQIPLHVGFVSATYRMGTAPVEAEVVLEFGANPPAGWSMLDETDKAWQSESLWQQAGSPRPWVLPWSGRPPSGFWVTWAGVKGKAWWPVNVASSSDLPPPDELKNLPLDVLIDILSSARPLHEALRGYLRRRAQSNPPPGTGLDLDPHKRVDVSGFLLQRTRRFSWALTGLASRLERPVTTEECLRWRIYGPVGVMAVAAAVEREAKSPDEALFLKAELALELSRVKPKDAPGSLPAKKVREALREAARLLREAPAGPGVSNTYLQGYLQKVYEEVEAR